MPRATDPRTPRISVSTKVMAGSSRNCARMPIEIALGRLAAALKSSIVVPSAMPNKIVAMMTRSITIELSSNEILIASTSARTLRNWSVMVSPSFAVCGS